jgi:hypothetical protein
VRKSNFALRLQPSLLDEARRIAEEERVAQNQLINVALAEKLSAIRTEAFFRERAHRANIPEAIEILERLGRGNPPMKGDKLPKAERLYILEGSHTSSTKRAKARTSRTSSRRA